jgi:CRP/FNR family transcriptional regulator
MAMQASLSLAELAQLMQMPAPHESPMALWRFALRGAGAGEALFRQGDRFRSMYVVRSGFFRSAFIRGAAEHVVGFPMPGDALGMDGVDRGVHPVETVALTDTQVAVVPYALLEQMEWLHGAPCEILVRLLCRDSACKADLLSLLGYRNSTQRAAAFLLYQGERFARIGYSRTAFPLPMRHADIGAYLHLRPETLSRAFAALSASGFATITAKAVRIHDAAGLQALAEGASPDDDVESHARSPRLRAHAAWAAA